jgi:4-amino-4-deoxy-L-arabinose transferase-like glycosyltransferase
MMVIDNRGGWLLMGFLLVVCVLGINRDLWTPDEPREAEISREMLISPGVVPTLNGQNFIEKPPLYYWAVAAVYKISGGPSAAAARSVSMVASFLTLLLVYFWGSRDFSRTVGLVAAVGLTTSVQFLSTSRWVVIDPLLMLFTTVAIWAGYDLIRDHARTRSLLLFYAALTLALWTKGLIGPVLIAAGLLAYLAARRSISPIWSLRPFTGIAVMLLATACLMALIYFDAGYDAVREWFWVNHVERFVDPVDTGHARPFYQYFEYLPMAIFPWWLPFVDLLKPASWRNPTAPNHDLKVYLATACIGMLIILSASTTKRSLYLMPLLPPLFLLLSSQAMAWWQRRPAGPLGGAAWWLQVVLVALFALVPTVVTLAYLQIIDPLAILALALIAALVVAVVVFSRRGDKPKAFAGLAACALAGVVVLMSVDFPLVGSIKDMSPYLTQVKHQLPADQPVYVTGRIDETLRGIVPFVMDRDMIEVKLPELYELRPACVIVQDKRGGETALQIESPYRQVSERNFGPGRYFALWCREHKN